MSFVSSRLAGQAILVFGLTPAKQEQPAGLVAGTDRCQPLRALPPCCRYCLELIRQSSCQFHIYLNPYIAGICLSLPFNFACLAAASW